jgi:hypothetical protein
MADSAGPAEPSASAAVDKKKKKAKAEDPEYTRLKTTVSVWWAQRKGVFNRHSFWRPK